jgi:aminopeptidase
MAYRFKILVTALISLLALLGGNSRRAVALQTAPFNVEKLLVDVFDPLPGDRVLVLVDIPAGVFADNPAWADRRRMAAEWWAACQQLGAKRGFEVYPLLSYPATGAHSAPLPEYGEMDGQTVRLEEILAKTSLALALTEYSATAPLVQFTARYPGLRAASMPMISRGMQQTALAADYGRVAERVQILAARLDRAQGAVVQFSTGQQLYVDLRHRHALADDGQLHADKVGERVINLPGGEAYIAPYEGEIAGDPSRTEGAIPILSNGVVVVVQVKENRVVDVEGDSPGAAALRAWFAVDPARCNIAELGLGANDRAVVTGNVLEDEKVFGMHLANGRSEHIGGTVGPDDFQDPANIVHRDIVYAKGGAIEVTSLVLEYEDGSAEQILRAGGYTIFHAGPSTAVKALVLTGLVLAAGALTLYRIKIIRPRWNRLHTRE